MCCTIKHILAAVYVRLQCGPESGLLGRTELLASDAYQAEGCVLVFWYLYRYKSVVLHLS